MKLPMLTLLMFAISACASLKDEVFQKIHEGDSVDVVKGLLGNPSSFGASQRIPGAQAWYYVRRGEQCGFTINEGKVAAIACGDNPNYISPTQRIGAGLGAGLKTMGDSMSNSLKNNVTCTTFGNTTTCH